MTATKALRSIRILLSVPILVCAVIVRCQAQAATTLSQIKKVYVAPLGNQKGADTIRNRIADRLRASGKLSVVDSPREADATITGAGGIWVTGYMSVGVRSSHANRQPVYDGFLSIEVLSNAGATIWSYLVTPSKLTFKSITNDLADQLVRKFLEAVGPEPQTPLSLSLKVGVESISIHGAGATFPWPLYKKWFESFAEKAAGLKILYDPVGSESGIRQLTEHRIDFAASDMPLSDQRMQQSQLMLMQIASVLGAVVPIYNLEFADRRLNFTPAALAGIYSGSIRNWDDPAIRASNPGIALPHKEIVVIHRTDGSGTTFVWTDYLSKVDPDWKKRVGASTTVSWPVGVGAELNEGVASMVRHTPNSIGYVELIYAIQHELSFGAVRNRAGNFIKADLSSVTAAASSMAVTPDSDFRISITDAPGKQAYPISTFTWLLLPLDRTDTRRTTALVEFLRWMLTSGQKQCASLGYAPLPSAVANKELQILDSLKTKE
jgi:phosphate ABC transporter phosphate-binding protein